MEYNELYHHGIKGMKWGVRRYRNRDGSLTPAGRKRYSDSGSNNSHEDYKKAHSKKSVKSMSDAELRSRLNRLQMEQQYTKLSSSNVNRGKKAANAILKTATTVATVTTTAITIYNNADKIRKIIRG